MAAPDTCHPASRHDAEERDDVSPSATDRIFSRLLPRSFLLFIFSCGLPVLVGRSGYSSRVIPDVGKMKREENTVEKEDDDYGAIVVG